MNSNFWLIQSFLLDVIVDNLQAYAEIESDTPGTVHGITNTKHGKSSTNVNEPQGEKDTTYSSTSTIDDRYAETQDNMWKQREMLIGFGILCVIAYLLLRNPDKSIEERIVQNRNVKPMPKEAADIYKWKI